MDAKVTRQARESNQEFKKEVNTEYEYPFQVAQDLFKDLLKDHSALPIDRFTLPSFDRSNYYTLDFSARPEGRSDLLYPPILPKANLILILCVRIDVEDKPIAMLRFERMPKHLLVTRLQEVKEQEKYLHQLQWRALLCRTVIVLASALGLQEVCLDPSCLSDVHALNSKLPEGCRFHWDVPARVYRCTIRA